MELLERALAWMRGPQTASSGIDRRKFLQILGGTAAGVAMAPLIDVEKLLWVPKPIVVVSEADVYGFVSADWIAREALKILENNLTIARTFARAYDEHWEAPQIGGCSVGGHVFNHTAHSVVMVPAEDLLQLSRREANQRFVRPLAMTLAARMARKPINEMGYQPPLSYPCVESASVHNSKTGLAVRATRTYDPVIDAETLHLDTIYATD